MNHEKKRIVARTTTSAIKQTNKERRTVDATVHDVVAYMAVFTNHQRNGYVQDTKAAQGKTNTYVGD